MIHCQIITLSDRAHAGIYTDQSSGLICASFEHTMREAGYGASTGFALIPDDPSELRNLIYHYTHNQPVDVIFTSGGTGIGPRDITPETIAPLLTMTLPGVMELIRVKYGLSNPKAALSRGIAGVRLKTLIFTLPGSPKAVSEYCEVIMPMLIHAIEMIKGDHASHDQPAETSQNHDQ